MNPKFKLIVFSPFLLLWPLEGFVGAEEGAENTSLQLLPQSPFGYLVEKLTTTNIFHGKNRSWFSYP